MKLSAIIIAKNEEKTIANCLKSVSWAEEIVLIDDESEDKTVKIAKKMGARVYIHKMRDFAQQREFGLKKARGGWVLYIDADERATEELRGEILEKLGGEEEKNVVAYRIKRKNFYFGDYQWPMVERIERLFLKRALKGWRGPIHESPIIDGKVGELKNYLLHYAHQNLESMVKKTNQWSEIEAEMLFKCGHPKMCRWRFLRIMLTKFWQSYIGQGGWKIGTPGLIESIYQAFSYFIIYCKLWEKQQQK